MEYKKITAEELKPHLNWFYIGVTNFARGISGWKLHIFGNELEDSVTLANALMPVLDKYKMSMKVATPIVFKAGIGVEGDIQYGKCATMYIPASVFLKKSLQAFIDDVKDAIKDYNKTGEIYGDRSLDGKIHYRYELGTPINFSVGVSYEQYMNLYRPNDGSYNIEGNPDPFLQ